MDWISAMDDLASSWKVGIAFIVLVVLRFLLTSQAVLLADVRAWVFGGLAGLLMDPLPGPSATELRDGDEVDDPPADQPLRVAAELPADQPLYSVAELPADGPQDLLSAVHAQEALGFGTQALVAGEPVESEAAEPPVRTRAEDLRGSVLEFVDSGLIALVLVFIVIRPFVVQAFYIPSGSMRPTLIENDKILVNKLVYRFGEPRRGDVVVFKAPPQAAPDEKDFIKRLVGLPGDVLEVRDGTLYVNGVPQREQYIAEPPAYDMPPVIVQPGKAFVMGDNRNDSNDSHSWGQLDEKRIRGKAMVVFWPIPRAGLIQ